MDFKHGLLGAIDYLWVSQGLSPCMPWLILGFLAGLCHLAVVTGHSQHARGKEGADKVRAERARRWYGFLGE